jgi:hypothetical protein
MDRQFMTTHKKTASEQLQADVLFYAIGLFCIAMVIRLFEFIFKPFEEIQMFGHDNTEPVIKKIEAKQQARDKFLAAIEQKVEDPMYQYQERFLINIAYHQKDPDNKIYQDWYEQWKKGHVLDSNLKWVPEVYNGEDFNPNFLRYMRIQLRLHKRTSLAHRIQFSNTLFRFYPEFSCSLKGFERDLERYESMVADDLLSRELKTEINKFGLCDSIAEYLSHKDFTAETLEKKAKLLKVLVERGYKTETCIAVIEKFTKESDADVIALAGSLDTFITKSGLPPDVCADGLNGDIDIDDLVSIANEMKESISIYGPDIFREQDGQTLYQKILNERIRQARAMQQSSKRL